jgi:membrane protease YdiL (CAAX protease family)
MMTAAISNTDVSVILQDQFIALIAFLILYLTYYFGSDFGFVKKIRIRFGETPDSFEKSVFFRRTLGFVLLGIIPFFIALIFFEEPIAAYGIAIPSGPYAFLWFLIPTVVIVGGSALRSGKKIDTSYYPEVRQKIWTRRRTAANLLFWAIYLLGYEFAIRGMLFFTSLYAFGLWPAIIINSVIYSLIHIFKGPQEAYGAFFLGIVFCLITYYTNSFWIAFTIHFLLAAINDMKAVKSSPEMIYDFGKKS